MVTGCGHRDCGLGNWEGEFMKHDLRVWVALLGVAVLVFSAAPASAFSYIPSSGWQLFMTAADIDAPRGFVGTPGNNPTPLQKGGMYDIWSEGAGFSYDFTLGGSSILRVTDVDESGDRYRIWDGDTYKGITIASIFEGGLKDTDPDPAYAHGGFWNGSPIGPEDYTLSTSNKAPGMEIMLAAGEHHLTFQNFSYKDGPAFLAYDPLTEVWQEGMARAFFRVDPIPEPATMALLGLGLAFAGLVIRRKR
jgi:hypothetical protein